MKHSFVFFSLALFILTLTVAAQTWDGYILVGRGDSYTHGDYDFLVYKLDAAGAKQWRKNYGGSESDYGGNIQQTADGGYILSGYGSSYTHGYEDLLVYKLDAAGAKQWRRNYGGGSYEYGGFIQQTTDGGYILCGYGSSYTHGSYDLLVYKLDAGGVKRWRKNYGGSESEYSRTIQQTADGGYILGGYGSSYTHGEQDLLVYKLDAAGAKEWRKNYGGSGSERGGYIQQTADGGYILGGYGSSYTHGDDDLLVYKLDARGVKQWRKNYGGSEHESGGYIRQTADGGYILGGSGHSYTHGSYDLLVYKLDAAGAKQWRKNYGSSDWEGGGYIQQTADGGYILGGSSETYTHGATDLLVYKLDAAGAKEWRKNYGGDSDDEMRSIGLTYQ